MKKLTYKMAAAITAGAFAFEADLAHATPGVAGSGFDTIVKNIEGGVSDLPRLLSILSYLAGIAFVVGGIFKLKSHVENPQTPLKDAVIRIGVGGALLAAPTVIQAAVTSIGDADGSTSYRQDLFGNLGG